MAKRVQIDVVLDETGAEFPPSEFHTVDPDTCTANDVLEDLKWQSKREVIADLDLIATNRSTIYITVIDDETGEVTRADW